MTNTYIKIIMFVLIFISFCQNKNSKELVLDEDSVLKKLRSALPDNWSMTKDKRELIIKRNGFVLVLFENQINAPFDRENKEERINRIKKLGKKGNSQIIYRLEKKWSKQKIQQAKNQNTLIYKKIKELPEKHNIIHLYSKSLSRKGGEYFIGITSEEKERIKAYYKERNNLENQLIKLPDCNSVKYSLFLISKTGYNDGFHIIHPEEASQEMYKIENLINELFLGN